MFYTHNLKIILLDKDLNIIDNIEFLQKIKDIICKEITQICIWNGEKNNITIKWKLIELNNIQKNLMGDLFSSPIYDSDELIYAHTQQTIEKINSDYNIQFHISRMIGEKVICKNSVDYIK